MSGSPLQQWFSTAMEQYTAMQSAIGPLRLTKSDLLFLSMRKMCHDVGTLLSDLLDDARSATFGERVKMILIIITPLIILASYLLQTPSSASQLGLPIYNFGRDYNYPELLTRAAKEHPHTPYIIKFASYEYIVFPSSFFDEIKRIPASTGSMVEWFTHVFFQGWRFLGSDKSNLHKTIATDLTRAFSGPQNAVLSGSEQERHVDMAFTSVLGMLTREKWQRFPLYSLIQELVAIKNTACLLGEDMAHNRQWIRVSQAFPMAVMIAVFACHAVPRVLRPLVSLFVFIPAWALYWYMRILLRPMVKKEIADYMEQRGKRKKDTPSDTGLHKSRPKIPMTSWLLSRYLNDQTGTKAGNAKVPSAVINEILHDYTVLSFEATASTSATLYFILAELVTRPELIQELREEMTAVMGSNQKHSTDGLEKLDSVMRESSRVHNFNHLSLFRRLLTPVQLSMGPTLPPGSLLCVDAYSIISSPVLWKDPGPEVFDPLRFWKLSRQEQRRDGKDESGTNKMYKFTSLGSDAPGWGGGSQACPGRVFAGDTIKRILARLLMEFDIEVAHGEKKPSRNSMPNGTLAPDMGAGIMLRRRT
ncbi:cytochrome P450 [Rhypophila decipiens]|uniref:Cytochrome P450 n=1 Tax=Rhypophila decipiens TaxID=261697 RepID=A0AAN7B438_9PEZI|nr:cytochrome P450 [Rhypophila decipiens]